MSLVSILGDTHFGARGDSEAFRDHQFKFYDDVFFPYLRDNNIKTVIQMGDLMDRRKFVNYQTLTLMRDKFINNFQSGEFELHVIVGNHDTYFRHTNKVNSLNELFDGVDNVNIYQQTKEIKLGNKKFLMMPWINEENREESIHALETSNSDILVGHLEVDGFEMHRGMPSKGGMSPSLFRRFGRVWSGHYHCQSEDGNIAYLGTPYELTWSDYNDTKGFHVYDTERDTMKFIKNPYSMFHKIFYNDAEQDYSDFDVKSFKDSIIKLIVVEKNDSTMFENLIERFKRIDTVDFNITDSVLSYRDVDIEDIEVEDALSTLHKHVDLVENHDIDKSRLRRLLQEIHTEAVTIMGDK